MTLVTRVVLRAVRRGGGAARYMIPTSALILMMRVMIVMAGGKALRGRAGRVQTAWRAHDHA